MPYTAFLCYGLDGPSSGRASSYKDTLTGLVRRARYNWKPGIHITLFLENGEPFYSIDVTGAEFPGHPAIKAAMTRAGPFVKPTTPQNQRDMVTALRASLKVRR